MERHEDLTIPIRGSRRPSTDWIERRPPSSSEDRLHPAEELRALAGCCRPAATPRTVLAGQKLQRARGARVCANAGGGVLRLTHRLPTVSNKSPNRKYLRCVRRFHLSSRFQPITFRSNPLTWVVTWVRQLGGRHCTSSRLARSKPRTRPATSATGGAFGCRLAALGRSHECSGTHAAVAPGRWA